MKIQRLIPAFCGLILSGGLIATSAKAAEVKELNCVKGSQEVSCPVDRSLNSANNLQQGNSSLESTTNPQLEQLSSILLAIIYLGLPSALVFAVLLEEKNYKKAIQLMERQSNAGKTDLGF